VGISKKKTPPKPNSKPGLVLCFYSEHGKRPELSLGVTMYYREETT